MSTILIMDDHEGDRDKLAAELRAAGHTVLGGGGTVGAPQEILQVRERAALEDALRRAVEEESFELHYQPKADLASGRIAGAEALLRWTHPELGAIGPARFIPVAESSGLIVPLGDWVLGTACRQNRAWQDAGLPPMRMAVNLSPRQFRQADLVDKVDAALRASGLDAQYLELEITESMAMSDSGEVLAKLSRLKALGIHLSIDDFGTGYSSLSYLKRFPVDSLKIDQSFVRDLATDPGDALIVRSVISLGHSLNLRVIAEGVETEAQLAFLRRQKCDEMQGYFFSAALPTAAFGELLASGARLRLPQEEGAAHERTLLLVDDEAGVTSALRRMLRNEGYRILCAQSAAEGLSMLARHPVQVVISDQRMPGASGTQFLAQVKQVYPQTLRMILSGYADTHAILEAINGGAIHRFLLKPWDDEQLRASIREAFEQHWAIHGGQSEAILR